MIKGALVVGSSQIRMPGALMVGAPYDLATLTQIIKDIFKSGEQGFAYDINDLSTLFQDAAGTIPVTGAEQPVGLVLDKSKGLTLGSELVVNGDFSNGTTGWVARANTSLSIVNGKLRVTAIAAGAAYGVDSNFAQASTSGRFYKVSANLSRNTTRDIYTRFTTSTSSVIRNSDFSFFDLSAGASALAFAVIGAAVAGEYFEIDNVTVRQISGNHAYQTTPSMRPLLQNSPRKIDYDGVDDKLTASLPAQLTGCTVIRAVPSVGAQILTNQTIATPYNDSTDHCGLIVINRALTQTETTQITQIFNRLAGV